METAMKPVDLSQIRTLLCDITHKAGRAALKAQATTHAVKDIGGGGGITTQADLDAQEIIVSALREAYPDIPIVAEEGNGRTVCPDQCFIIDPVDGSAPYKAGAPHWTSTTAYRGPEGSVGVIYQPARGALYVTGDEWVEIHRDGSSIMEVMRPIKPRNPQWRIAMPFARDFSDQVLTEVFLPIITDPRVRAPENVSCNTVHFLELFEGWVDGAIMWAKVWDSEAAIAMAKHLGIIVTDFTGNEPDRSIVEPDRLVFARGKDVHDLIISHTKNWPYDNEMRE